MKVINKEESFKELSRVALEKFPNQPVDLTDYCDVSEVLEAIGEELEIIDREDHRWWTICTQVYKVGEALIGLVIAETTGDRSPNECGWEYPEEDFLYAMKETTRITYSYQ